MNHALLSELGRYPLHYDIVSRLLKYCSRLENLTREREREREREEKKRERNKTFLEWT